MTIKNFDQLASTPLRKDALTIVEAGYQAIQTDRVIQDSVSISGDTLTIQDNQYDLSAFENVYVIAFGKSSYLACKAFEDILGDRITKGIGIGVTEGETLQQFDYVVGTHPRPSETNHEQAKKIIELVEGSTDKDLIIGVISGGGSALFAAPFEIDIQTQADVGDALMNGGANIHELNIVRKHLSRVKGGRLASLAYPAKLVTVIFSDVPGNDLSTIASGATVKDDSTNEQAQSILDQFGVMDKVDLDSLELSETPKEDKYFEAVDNILVLEPTSAVDAMVGAAEDLGYDTRVLSTTLEGDSHEVGKQLLDENVPGEALVAAGETTVNVKGDGQGGRNQELVLANLDNIGDGQVLVSAASDGADHSPGAGAIGDKDSKQKGLDAGVEVSDYLDNNDSYNYFKQSGDMLDTGALDSNVADMYLVLRAKE